MDIIIQLIMNSGQFPVKESILSTVIYYFSQGIGILFFIMYFHQFFYLLIGTLKQSKIKSTKETLTQHKLGIVISARNESLVIGNLIKSIRDNDYPQELVEIFVVADNCTDNTADICRDLGCTVVERFNQEQIGKGYALHYLFDKLHNEEQYADKVPEAYIIIDADNLIKSNYITEMNKAYDAGHDVVTSYRNTKNFGKNWITAGYGYWFLHEARHLNNARMLCGNSCALSGTGFLIAKKVVEEYDNWKFFTLTEDIECSTEYALSGRKVAYCGSAEIYDEQPEKFRQAWRQRERWARGLYQVMAKKGGRLLLGMFGNFSCWDIFTSAFAALLLLLANLFFYSGALIAALVTLDFNSIWYMLQTILIGPVIGTFVVMTLIGGLVMITEWKKIGMPVWKKIAYLIAFPIYMITYIPIGISAIFKKVKWKPIEHKSNRTLEEVEAEVEENAVSLSEYIKKKNEDEKSETMDKKE